ncbi:hypothetical protein TNCV_1476801 [Trichonephila clavipes]|nr:hypothetical protein TNCV_1476801 [Trichonephila clavipes]
MFWRYLTPGGPGSLVPVEGIMRSKQYISIIESKIVPMMPTFARGVGIFQTNFVKKYKIMVLKSPGNSPDVNTNENCGAL